MFVVVWGSRLENGRSMRFKRGGVFGRPTSITHVYVRNILGFLKIDPRGFGIWALCIALKEKGRVAKVAEKAPRFGVFYIYIVYKIL